MPKPRREEEEEGEPCSPGLERNAEAAARRAARELELPEALLPEATLLARTIYDAQEERGSTREHVVAQSKYSRAYEHVRLKYAAQDKQTRSKRERGQFGCEEPSEYEKARLQRMRENDDMLLQIGISTTTTTCT